MIQKSDNLLLDECKKKHPSLEHIAYLVEQCDANPNFHDEKGWTALHYLCNTNKVSLNVLVYLLEKEADPGAMFEEDEERNCLHILFDNEEIDIQALDILLNYHAKPLYTNSEGRDPIHYALKRNNISVLLFLANKNIEWFQDRKLKRNKCHTNESICFFIELLLATNEKSEQLKNKLAFHLLEKYFSSFSDTDIRNQKKISYLRDNYTKFPPSIKQQIEVFLLSVKNFSKKHHFFMPKPLVSKIISESLSIDCLTPLISELSNEEMKEVLNRIIMQEIGSHPGTKRKFDATF